MCVSVQWPQAGRPDSQEAELEQDYVEQVQDCWDCWLRGVRCWALGGYDDGGGGDDDCAYIYICIYI